MRNLAVFDQNSTEFSLASFFAFFLFLHSCSSGIFYHCTWVYTPATTLLATKYLNNEVFILVLEFLSPLCFLPSHFCTSFTTLLSGSRNYSIKMAIFDLKKLGGNVVKKILKKVSGPLFFSTQPRSGDGFYIFSASPNLFYCMRFINQQEEDQGNFILIRLQLHIWR